MKTQTLMRFVDRYQPVKTQSQIGETLHCILGTKSLHRLQNYELQIFRKLNYAILDDKQNERTRKPEDIDLNESLQKTVDNLIAILEGNDNSEDAKRLRAAANLSVLNSHDRLSIGSK